MGTRDENLCTNHHYREELIPTSRGAVVQVAMKYSVSTLWLSPPGDLKSRIERCIEEAAELNKSKEPVYIFFAPTTSAFPQNNLTGL